MYVWYVYVPELGSGKERTLFSYPKYGRRIPVKNPIFANFFIAKLIESATPNYQYTRAAMCSIT